MTVRVAFFSGLIAVITTVLIPVAHFGDKNDAWTKAFDRHCVRFVDDLSRCASVLADCAQLAKNPDYTH